MSEQDKTPATCDSCGDPLDADWECSYHICAVCAEYGCFPGMLRKPEPAQATPSDLWPDAVKRAIGWARSRDDHDSPASVLADEIDRLRADLASERAKGEAYPPASESERKAGWIISQKYLEAIRDALRAKEEEVPSWEGIEAVILEHERRCLAPDATALWEAAKEMAEAVALLPADDGRILGLLPILCRLRQAIVKAKSVAPHGEAGEGNDEPE